MTAERRVADYSQDAVAYEYAGFRHGRRGDYHFRRQVHVCEPSGMGRDIEFDGQRGLSSMGATHFRRDLADDARGVYAPSSDFAEIDAYALGYGADGRRQGRR